MYISLVPGYSTHSNACVDDNNEYDDDGGGSGGDGGTRGGDNIPHEGGPAGISIFTSLAVDKTLRPHQCHVLGICWPLNTNSLFPVQESGKQSQVPYAQSL